ncbi:hypothetical protein [Photobacterium minamisatsumaniensis]|uniref:hypothetical protein n=1 Tax=Photobacterium minamisatsumaniensis TaxID=2910233 RepID=UPI003D098135
MVVRVYQFDGTLQCGMGNEISLEEMQKQLEGIVGKVNLPEKRQLPFVIPSACIFPTGQVNTYQISNEQWRELFKYQKSSIVKYGVWIWDKETVYVYQYDGTVQCSPEGEISLDEMEATLTGNGINVISKRKGTDGLNHIDMCGASTGSVNIYEIKTDDLDIAIKLKFMVYVGPKDIREILGSGESTLLFSDFEQREKVEYWPWPV